MTRYEEIQEELRQEAARLVAAFKASAKVGDFAILDGEGGIIAKKSYGPGLNFVPIVYGNSDLTRGVKPMDEDTIPRVALLGDDFSKIAALLVTKAKAESSRHDDIPF